MNKLSSNPKDLLQEAHRVDGLGAQASAIMINNLDAVTLPACIGTPVNEIGSTDIHLLTFVLDESGTMHSVWDEVITGFNQMITDLKNAKIATQFIVQAWAFNNNPRLIFGWTPLEQVQPLTRQNYSPGGGTALYDATLDALTSLTAYVQELVRAGTFVKSRVIVFSDGDDNSSASDALANVGTVAEALLRQENYILAYAGFNTLTSHETIAAGMRFPNILVAGGDPTGQYTDMNDPKAIRQVFQASSASLIRASRTTTDPDASNTFFA